MVIHNRAPERKPFLWVCAELFAAKCRSSRTLAGLCFTAVSSPKTPILTGPNVREINQTFDEMRRTVSLSTWRLSPNVPGLSIVKRTILTGRSLGLIRTVTAQRLIDLTKSWEA